MSMRFGFLRAAVLGCVVFSLARCSSDSHGGGIKSGCIVNSDCNNPLACSFGLCHQACKESRDCPTGQHCLALEGGAVCQLDADVVECVYSSQCKKPLKCAVDSRCRVPCEGSGDCLASQVCTQHVCADKDELNPDTKSLDVTNTTDPWSGGSSTDGGVEGSTGSGGKSGAGGAGGAGGKSGAGGSSEGPDSGQAGNGGAGGSSGSGGKGSGGKSSEPVDSGSVGEPTCGDAGISGFHPSNLPASLNVPSDLIDLTFFSDAFDTGNPAPNAKAPAWDTFYTPPVTTQTVVKLSDGREAAVLWVKSFTLASGAKFNVRGTRPLIVMSEGSVEIDGIVSAAADPLRAWYAGGAPATTTAARAGTCPIDTEAGGGRPGQSDMSTGIGSGGGGFCGSGGPGSTDLMGTTRPAGGVPYGIPALIPIVGGSAGGTGASGNGGHGGGAVQLVSGVSIVVGDSGVIDMAGGGGSATVGAGGSGGAILLEAPSVTVRGVLAANGGSGGDFYGGVDGMASSSPALGHDTGGNGGAGDDKDGTPANEAATKVAASGGGGGVGRIRINTGCGGSLVVSSSAVISPSSKSKCYTTGDLL
jgi:hypothetical protein